MRFHSFPQMRYKTAEIQISFPLIFVDKDGMRLSHSGLGAKHHECVCKFFNNLDFWDGIALGSLDLEVKINIVPDGPIVCATMITSYPDWIEIDEWVGYKMEDCNIKFKNIIHVSDEFDTTYCWQFPWVSPRDSRVIVTTTYLNGPMSEYVWPTGKVCDNLAVDLREYV